MMATHDWMAGFNQLSVDNEIVEVRFKNNRKEFYLNNRMIRLEKDDRVVVDVEGGHDLGTVSLTGSLAEKQFSKKSPGTEKTGLRSVYRKAKDVDLDNWLEARRNDRAFMIKCRELAAELGLDMSISDAEIRADNKKVTFFYTADGRVDFRELLKKLMDAFRMKIEMRQIGARQNAARTGGIGSCGRELCCSTWKTDMQSVKTDAARKQDLSLSASRLAGQCGKLKCCLNYELETYLEAWESFPAEIINLDSDKGVLSPVNADILKGVVHYSLGENGIEGRYTLSIDQVKKFISLNKKGKLVLTNRLEVQ